MTGILVSTVEGVEVLVYNILLTSDGFDEFKVLDYLASFVVVDADDGFKGQLELRFCRVAG